MVSVQQTAPNLTPPTGDQEQAWFDALSDRYTPTEIETLRQAFEFSRDLYLGHVELTGTPLLEHALGAASILLAMHLDHETITATLLHAVPAYLDDWQQVLETRFGTNVARMVEGLSRMEQIREFSEMAGLHKPNKKKADDGQQIESLRKMLLAMAEDIRVVLIKLAERTQTMRNLSAAPQPLQQQIAHETRGIFAPLANRLGIWQMKWELEDLSLRYLEPQLYKEVAKLLAEKRVDRERYITDIIGQLQHELTQAGIGAEVTGRPKHIHSIINKMRRKHLEFSELYDVRAVRILVDDIKGCYTALGLIHNMWQPIPGEFDDYIARPKSNNYQSLHTAVIGPQGLALEVQIRTHEMHHHSELGVAAHWRYKEGGKSDAKFDEKIAWLRQILAWKEDVSESDLLEQFNSELFQDKLYVLTPQGRVIDLPEGATPVDFAYTLHTDLGHRTRGAKVDGHIVPLNYKLQNGQRVEILTAKQGAPSRDWLTPSLGYLQSQRARAKVRHWFKYQNFEENVSQGRAKLERELHRLGIGTINHEKIAQKFHFHKLEDFLAAIGRGDVTEHQIELVLREEIAPQHQEETDKPLFIRPEVSAKPLSGITLEGVGNVLTNLAKCCKPAPPDAIVGYVTRDRGVTIHRRSCAFIARLDETRQARLLQAQWGNKNNTRADVDIEVEADDRQGLLRDISDLFAREKINVIQVNTLSKNALAKMQFSVEISSLEQLERLLALIHQVPGVSMARRKT